MSELISCGKCGEKWSGVRVCHCGGCHETFSSLSAFDAHQRGTTPGQLCKKPEEMTDKEGIPVFEQVEKPWGWVWGYPKDENAGSWWDEVANPERTKL